MTAMSVWLLDAKRVTPSSPGGAMDGTHPRAAVWHTTEGTTIAGAQATLLRNGDEPHLIWDPTTGEFVQFIPADKSSRSLKNDGFLKTNRVGTIRVQIEVVGYAKHPFTDGPLVGLNSLLPWLDQLGIPRSWPYGPPPAYPASYGVKNGYRDRPVYVSNSGHMCHSNVPGNDHGDPGAIDIAKLTPRLRPHMPPPKPTPVPVLEDDEMVRYVLPKGWPGVKTGQQVLICAGKQVYLNSGAPSNVPLTAPEASQVNNYAAAFGPIEGTPNP